MLIGCLNRTGRTHSVNLPIKDKWPSIKDARKFWQNETIPTTAYMGLLRGNLTWDAYVGILRGTLTWESYVGLFRGNLTWESYVELLRGNQRKGNASWKALDSVTSPRCLLYLLRTLKQKIRRCKRCTRKQPFNVVDGMLSSVAVSPRISKLSPRLVG